MGALTASGRPLFYRVAGNSSLVRPESGTGMARERAALHTHVRALGGMQKEALVASHASGALWRLASDEGAYLNGDDEAPCPLAFLTTGMICASMDAIRGLAQQRGIDIRRIRLVQDNYYTMRGSALRGTMTGGARDVELQAQIDAPASADELLRLLADATRASPINALMRQALPGLFSLTHNGAPVACQRVAELPSSASSVLADAEFDAARPAPGSWQELIRRIGPSPQTAETTGFAGSSLTDEQDRVLHVRGICSLREDGLKCVEQQLFNPHGSMFEFLSDEAPAQGGTGLAPDALSYASAGIAFCFMTQLGRYAAIAKRRLSDYRIAQTTRFSSIAAAIAAGEPGQASPVETVVALESGEDDDFARQALDMAEQTCFLHALCRAELRTRIRLREFT